MPKWKSKAAGGVSGRARHDDRTAQGVAIPLASVAVVCLLATCGVWLFSGEDSGDKPPRRTGMDATVAVVPDDVPASAPVAPPPSLATDKPAGSTVSASAQVSQPPPEAPGAPTTAAAAPATTPGAVPVALPGTPPPGAAPAAPAPGAPPASSAPPQAGPTALTVTVTGSASEGTVTVRNNTSAAVAAWDLRVNLTGNSAFAVWYSDGPVGSTAHGSVATATATADNPLDPGEAVEIYFRINGDRKGATCALSGQSCSFGI